MKLQTELEEAVKGLPPTGDGIAEYFQDLGVKGVPSYMCACPVSRWLRELLDVPTAYTDVDFIKIVDEEGDEWQIPTPDSVTGFIAGFDLREYPNLIDAAGPTDEEDWTENDLDTDGCSDEECTDCSDCE